MEGGHRTDGMEGYDGGRGVVGGMDGGVGGAGVRDPEKKKIWSKGLSGRQVTEVIDRKVKIMRRHGNQIGR
jgi:hypothetical protein